MQKGKKVGGGGGLLWRGKKVDLPPLFCSNSISSDRVLIEATFYSESSTHSQPKYPTLVVVN